MFILDMIHESESFDVVPKNQLAGLPKEDQKLFWKFGVGKTQSLPYTQVQHAFSYWAERTPNATAIDHLGKKISYKQLDEQSNKVANFLKEIGIGTGDHVGLFLQRSIPMIIGILGILKSGAAYVPQHVGVATDEQLQHIVDKAKLKVTLTAKEHLDMLPALTSTTVLAIEDILESSSNTEATRSHQSGSSTCFVLFTSGTTGMPNGVQVTHENVCNILHLSPGNLNIQPGDKVSQILNIAFDMAAWEILGALSHGACLLIRGKNIEETASKADVVIATPSILARFNPQNFERVKTVAVAGEPCPLPLAKEWAKRAKFYNCCGPTETTIVNTMAMINQKTDKAYIGKPTLNNTVYVLDEHLNPLPIGEVGEMWAGGLCVTKGYIQNEELNRDRYRPDPFLGNGRVMFRTRDLGRWSKNGELEHFGRTDDQVKIKGFRVELDSISAVLENLEPVGRAVTLKFNATTLVSFFEGDQLNEDLAKLAVAEKLPYYCCPKRVFRQEVLPRTDRGKIDKAKLTKLAVELMKNQGAKS